MHIKQWGHPTSTNIKTFLCITKYNLPETENIFLQYYSFYRKTKTNKIKHWWSTQTIKYMDSIISMDTTHPPPSGGSHNQQQPELPPGFRFHPTDEELVVHYLRRKVQSTPLPVSIIAEVDLYKFDPWELPGNFLFFLLIIRVEYISWSLFHNLKIFCWVDS